MCIIDLCKFRKVKLALAQLLNNIEVRLIIGEMFMYFIIKFF